VLWHFFPSPAICNPKCAQKESGAEKRIPAKVSAMRAELKGEMNTQRAEVRT
jgi:hypothetical protein